MRDVPRKGNVDRNIAPQHVAYSLSRTFPARGTWIEICSYQGRLSGGDETFPARGTWIEIKYKNLLGSTRPDVPRKGNVDRNEHSRLVLGFNLQDVPRKGNVDRNVAASSTMRSSLRRSPQGERG